MKKILLLTLVFCIPYFGFSQIGIFENFNQGQPTGWVGNASAVPFEFNDESACEGLSANAAFTGFFSFSAQLTSGNIAGQSNGTDFTLDFDYKVVDATDGSAFPSGWGTAEVQYSTDNGGSWTTFGTIDDTNYTSSADCVAAPTFTVAAADLPNGADFKLRYVVNRNVQGFRFVLDNISGTQVLNAPPNCDVVMTTPADGATDVNIATPLEWSPATGLPSGYLVSVGTTPGGTDILDNEDVGSSTQINNVLPGALDQYDATFYVTIVPYNSVGNATACQEFSFTTETNPHEIVDCSVGSINNSFCYTNGGITEFSYTSNDGTPLNLIINEGQVEDGWDELIVLDSDGTTVLNPGEEYGPNGDGNVGGMFFQSSGSVIYIQVDADFINDCASEGYTPIDYTVACATCVFQDVSYNVVDDCANDQFFVDVVIDDLGTATSITIEDDQGNSVSGVSANGQTEQFGPYPIGTGVSFTTINEDDANCTITSGVIRDNCPPPNNTCDSASVAVINPDNFCETLNFGTLEQSSGSSVPVSCAGPAAQDVWFEFTATATTITSTIITDGFGGPSHAIYADDCGNLTELYCSEEFDNFGDSDAIVAQDLIIGETYKIRVFSDTQSDEEFELCLTTPQFGEDNSTCDVSAPFCAPFDDQGNPQPLIFPNGYFYLTESVAETGPDYGCLGSEPNPAWFFMQVQETGDLGFTITQNTAYNENGEPIGDGLDVDFIAYGPFTEAESNCGDLTAANTVDCSYSAAAIEEFTIPNAQAGEYYAVVITNFNQQPGYISLGQTNFGEPDAGSTNCDLVFENTIRACAGEEVTMISEFDPADIAAYQWYAFDEALDDYVAINEQDAFNEDYTTDVSGQYFVQTFETGTFLEEREFFTVVIEEEPEITVPQDLVVCEGQTINLDATPANSDSYGSVDHQWFLDGNEISGATDPTHSVTQGGEYSVIVTTSNGSATGEPQVCETEFIFPVQGGAFEVDLGQDQVLCDADPQTITANIIDGDAANATYAWSTGETTSSIEVNTTGTYEVTVTIDGCPVTNSVDYTFNVSPEIDLGAETLISCDLASEVLDATASNYTDAEVTYEWTLDGAVISGAITSTLTPTDYGTYEVTVTPNGTSCSSTGSVTIEERDDILVDVVPSASIDTVLNYCEDGTGTPDIPVYEVVLETSLTNATADEVEFTWYKNDVQLPETTSSITVVYDEQGVFNDEYYCVINIDNCTATSNLLVTDIEIAPYENAGCKITQGLSPDETPGENDVLDLAFLNDRSGIESVEIFDRNGRSVFFLKDYVNEFNGQSDEGDKLINGTYFYVIKLRNEDPVFGRQKTGWIYIKRN